MRKYCCLFATIVKFLTSGDMAPTFLLHQKYSMPLSFRRAPAARRVHIYNYGIPVLPFLYHFGILDASVYRIFRYTGITIFIYLNNGYRIKP